MKSITLLLAAVLLLCGVGPGHSSGISDTEKDVGLVISSDAGGCSFEAAGLSFELSGGESFWVYSFSAVAALGDLPGGVETPTAWVPECSGGSGLPFTALLAIPGLGYSGLPVLAWRCCGGVDYSTTTSSLPVSGYTGLPVLAWCS